MFKRTSGLLMHISSLPSPYGIGDLGVRAYEFLDKLVAAQQGWWQILPLNPTNNQNSNSPYFSSSAFAGNPLLIDPLDLQERGLCTTEQIQPPQVTDTSRVDFDAVRNWKMPLLRTAWQNFKQRADQGAFYEFSSAQADWLDEYALYTALHAEYQGQAWNEWPTEFRTRNKEALAEFKARSQDEIGFVKFCQYIFFEQWYKLKQACNNKGIQIVGDLPIYVSLDSADVWANQGIFKLDDAGQPIAVSGVPPDYFSKNGQLWNNPVYNWQLLQETGFDWWVRRMRAVLERYDIVRIDHFRGLVQYWEVPAGEPTAINGSWQDVPTRAFLDTLQAKLPDFPVIAEDLGTITADVHEIMQAYGYPGMKVLLFAFGDQDPQHPYLPHNYEKNYIVYTGTHDNNTFRGWFEEESSLQEKERFFEYLGRELPGKESCQELVRLALSSVADVAVIPVQDLLYLPARARVNNPAHIMDNWHWRITPEEYTQLPLDWMAKYTSIYGRANTPD